MLHLDPAAVGVLVMTSEERYGEEFTRAVGSVNAPAIGELFALTEVITPFAVRVAATLRLADLVAAGTSAIDELAAGANADRDVLARLLRLLVARGVFREPEPGVYALTELSEPLRDDHPAGLRALFDIEGPAGRAEAASTYLLHSTRTGEPAYAQMFGRSFWDDLSADPKLAASFENLMTAQLAGVAAEITGSCDWTTVRTVVDVGGGRGAQLADILHSHPGMRGTLVEEPAAAAAARDHLADEGLADRCTIVPGSFFDRLPADGDAYLLCRVLHNWNDASATRILRRCVEAAAPSGRVIIVEGAVDTENPLATPTMDLRMLISLGGRERTLDEFRRLTAAAGLTIARHTATRFRTVIECATS